MSFEEKRLEHDILIAQLSVLYRWMIEMPLIHRTFALIKEGEDFNMGVQDD